MKNTITREEELSGLQEEKNEVDEDHQRIRMNEVDDQKKRPRMS